MSPPASSRARRVVSLAGAATLRPGAADRWLIGLRWMAMTGMLVTILVAKRFVPGLRTSPLWLMLVGIGAINVLWSIIVFGARRASEELVTAQLTGDLSTLGGMLWFSGGLANPFAPFLMFQIALAGLLCSRQSVVRVTMLAFVITVVLFFAPALPLESARTDPEFIRRLAHYVSLSGLAAFLGASVYVYRRRIEDLDADRARNERLVLLGRVAGGMAHELNTPLATILLASQELAHAGREIGDLEIARMSETLANEAKRASEVIDLLRGRVREGGRLEWVSLSQVVPQICQQELDRRGFAGRRALRISPGIRAYVSRAALVHLLRNVLSNAAQATASTEGALVEVVLDRDYDGRLRLVVADNGPGIRASLLPRVGEPFQTTKEGQGGMGLGLYVCSVLADRMGGELAIDSAEGEGTRVTLRLPPPPAPSALDLEAEGGEDADTSAARAALLSASEDDADATD